MFLLEIIAIIFTLGCVYFMSQQNILCWPIGIISIIAFFLIYLQEELYVNTGLQIVFLAQSIYGWYIWNKGKDDKKLPVTTLPMSKISKEIRGAIAIPLILVFLLNDNAIISDYLDAVSSGLALLATWYLVHKRLEAWIVWMSVNVMLFSLMLYQELHVLAGLEVILFVISLSAFISWKKDLKTDYV